MLFDADVSGLLCPTFACRNRGTTKNIGFEPFDIPYAAVSLDVSGIHAIGEVYFPALTEPDIRTNLALCAI